MTAPTLQSGLYANVFQVEIPDEPVSVMVASTATFPDLRPLREEIAQRYWNCRVYRVRDRIFGYGGDRDVLRERSFEPTEIDLRDGPALCKRLILEGFADHLKGQHYRDRLGKGRVTLYEPNPYGEAVGGQIQVYRGYDLRSIWWKQDEEISFGLIIDVHWEIQDQGGRRLSSAEIVQYHAMRQIAQIQEEILPTGKINTEVARLRLYNHILPFVRQNCRFSLPCGGEARINRIPVRVILGG